MDSLCLLCNSSNELNLSQIFKNYNSITTVPLVIWSLAVNWGSIKLLKELDLIQVLDVFTQIILTAKSLLLSGVCSEKFPLQTKLKITKMKGFPGIINSVWNPENTFFQFICFFLSIYNIFNLQKVKDFYNKCIH